MGQDTDMDDSIMADAVDLGDRDDPVKLLVLYFLQKKNQYVSELAGGFKGECSQCAVSFVDGLFSCTCS
jgi:hypothetical protein